MSSVTTFKELIVWRRSKEFVKEIYALCRLLPSDEQFGLCSQMKRASVSIPSNIAEGYRRKGLKEFTQFLRIASGSAAELETQLILVDEIFEVDTESLQIELVTIQKMLSALIKKVQA